MGKPVVGEYDAVIGAYNPRISPAEIRESVVPDGRFLERALYVDEYVEEGYDPNRDFRPVACAESMAAYLNAGCSERGSYAPAQFMKACVERVKNFDFVLPTSKTSMTGRELGRMGFSIVHEKFLDSKGHYKCPPPDPPPPPAGGTAVGAMVGGAVSAASKPAKGDKSKKVVIEGAPPAPVCSAVSCVLAGALSAGGSSGVMAPRDAAPVKKDVPAQPGSLLPAAAGGAGRAGSPAPTRAPVLAPAF